MLARYYFVMIFAVDVMYRDTYVVMLWYLYVMLICVMYDMSSLSVFFIPVTIDSDVSGTECIGQHTAVEIGAEHIRCFVADGETHQRSDRHNISMTRSDEEDKDDTTTRRWHERETRRRRISVAYRWSINPTQRRRVCMITSRSPCAPCVCFSPVQLLHSRNDGCIGRCVWYDVLYGVCMTFPCSLCHSQYFSILSCIHHPSLCLCAYVLMLSCRLSCSDVCHWWWCTLSCITKYTCWFTTISSTDTTEKYNCYCSGRGNNKDDGEGTGRTTRTWTREERDDLQQGDKIDHILHMHAHVPMLISASPLLYRIMSWLVRLPCRVIVVMNVLLPIVLILHPLIYINSCW